MNRTQEATSSSRRPATEPPQLAHDSLIDITEIRRIFKLGRTAAYELTHRPDFPDPVPISPRCYRWWASEVTAFANDLRRKPPRASSRRAARPRVPDLATTPRQIIGRVRAARTVRGTS